jgi:hypothetical protein
VNLKTLLKNIPGPRTQKKLICFQVDDYGNIRQNSQATFKQMEQRGFAINNHFDHYDGLSTSNDLTALFSLFRRFRDKNGHHPLFTAFVNPQNLNFDAIIASNYTDVAYEDFDISMQKYCQPDTVNILSQGIEERLFHPEYHGRSHFHEGIFLHNLKNKDFETLWCINHACYTALHNGINKNQSYLSTYTYNDVSELQKMKSHISEGVKAFERIFGSKPLHFTAPGMLTHNHLNEYLATDGILLIDTLMIKKQYEGQQKYTTKLNWLGRKNQAGQRIIIRNCVFEPNYGFTANTCLKQIEAAFIMQKPAIISTHRVNFCGRINEVNRNKGLKELNLLLNGIIKKWPDVEFVSSSEILEK